MSNQSSSTVDPTARFSMMPAACVLSPISEWSVIDLQSAGMPLGNVCVSIRFLHQLDAVSQNIARAR